MKRAAIWAALTAFALAAIVLAIGADTTPTNLDSRRLFGLWRARHVLAAVASFVAGIACVARARSRDALRTVLTATATTCIALAALEGLGRVGLIPWQSIFAPRFGDLGTLGTAPVPNQDVKGVSRKDTASVWGIPSEPIAFHYRTDRRGFRNPPDRETADVYLIGDSVLVGALVPFEKTLAPQLESMLQRPVLQAALINTAPQTMIVQFKKAGFDVRDRLVLQFVFEGNDLVDSAALQPERAATIAAVIESKSLFDHAWRLLATLSEPTLGVARTRSCTIGGSSYTFFWTAEHFAGHEAQGSVITRALETFGDELHAQGARYAVVVVPTKLRVLGSSCAQWPAGSELVDWRRHLSPLRDHVLAWGRERGVPVLDLTPSLEAAARAGTIPWFDTDTHWNEHGHEVAARAIADWDVVRRKH
jgi:SGNH hydrolase-like domain, acetyltransferase AlgX